MKSIITLVTLVVSMNVHSQVITSDKNINFIASPLTVSNSPLIYAYDSDKHLVDIYDEDFKERFLYCIGNFLLLSAPHNESIGNKPFEIKRATYNQLRQQREIQEMTEVDHLWDRKKIQYRKDKLVSFVLENL